MQGLLLPIEHQELRQILDDEDLLDLQHVPIISRDVFNKVFYSELVVNAVDWYILYFHSEVLDVAIPLVQIVGEMLLAVSDIDQDDELYHKGKNLEGLSLYGGGLHGDVGDIDHYAL